jgi:hypothetical protein
VKHYNNFYLVVIADYNDDDAHGIVHDNLYYWFDDNDLGIMEYDRVDVRPFNTVHTGYMLARRALNPLSPSQRQVFFVNTAPRMDDKAKRNTNQGEGFVLATLKNGKRIFAVNSGHTLSFVKPGIESLQKLNVPDDVNNIPMLVEALHSTRNIGAGQFRSGYVYPIITALALRGSNESISPQFDTLLGDDISLDVIPDIPDDVVAFCDGYQNVKTTVRPSALTDHFDQFAVVECQGREVIAHIARGMFDVPLHHFSLAAGSTILDYADGTSRQLVEVALRGGHAAKAFADTISTGERFTPREGAGVSWRLAEKEDFERLGFGEDGTPPAAILETALRL